MKKILLLSLVVLFTTTLFAQDLPTNAETGKCYVRCTTPDVWKNEEVSVQTAPSYKVLKAVGPQYTTENFTVESQPASTRLEVIPAQFETRDETMVVQEATSRLEVIPAVYETRNVEVVVKPASSRLEVIPAEWTTETVSYVKGTNVPSLRVVPAEFRNSSQTIVTKVASAMWVLGDKAPDCDSSDPNACRIWCYRSVPEQSVTVPVRELVRDAAVVTEPCVGSNGADCTETSTYTKRVLVKPATTRTIAIPAITKTIKTTVMVKPATTRTIAIPAVTKVIKKTVMVKPATTRSIAVPGETRTMKRRVVARAATTTESIVPSQSQTVTKQILVSKGGLTSWKEVDCKITKNTLLPINWNLGSATLTAEAKRIIDTRLMPILNDGVNIALASHTDSRGSETSNQRLSERRAQAVVNYLINQKGVNPSRLTGNGYGETRLTNRCSNGVSCTEAEHRANRRTTFRVVSSN